MLVDRRRVIGGFAVLALVLLRLVIGWHFFSQGVEKVERDPTTGGYRVAFSAEGFFWQAKGPLAGMFQRMVPDVHGWPHWLAVAQQSAPPSPEETAEQAQWVRDFRQRHQIAEREGQPAPIEFPPFAAHFDWAKRIEKNWRTTYERVAAIDGLSEEQRQELAAVFQRRLQQLADYFAAEEEAIAEYQHELWRLNNWRAAPEAKDVPFHQERIAAKEAETSQMAAAWVNQVRQFDRDYLGDLRRVLTAEQQADASAAAALDDALTSSRQKRLDRINLAVTVMTLGVGICLLVGLFTRLASLVGAAFLLAVMATQPPWVAEAAPIINEAIEFSGLLVLAGTGAGRWLGLDFFSYALFSRFRREQS